MPKSFDNSSAFTAAFAPRLSHLAMFAVCVLGSWIPHNMSETFTDLLTVSLLSIVVLGLYAWTVGWFENSKSMAYGVFYAAMTLTFLWGEELAWSQDFLDLILSVTLVVLYAGYRVMVAEAA